MWSFDTISVIRMNKPLKQQFIVVAVLCRHDATVMDHEPMVHGLSFVPILWG